MRAQRTTRRSSGYAWLRFGGACAIIASAAVTALGCGSAGSDETSSKDGGAEDASVADGTVTLPTDAGPAGDDAGSDAARLGDGGAESGTPCDPDASGDIDCTGRCGPVRDACSGAVKMCGGCAPAPLGDGGPGDAGTEARVCDLATNTCVKPKVTCAELGAQCGTGVRDSCGDFLDCPDTNPKGCPAGQQCNSDTNTCEACETVTCGDLGYQCGFAWLGCGPNTQANFTDCGGCAPSADGGAQICNTVFHNCEPNCKPASAAVVCAAARAASGVNCGSISDGCGGIVDCGSVMGFVCPNGESCGVRGIANHCDPQETPDECVALGKTCGDITSSCTGRTIHCGDCAAGQVCNSNGVCGPPCTAKTCADYAQFACGTFTDGCGSTITCGTCPGGVCDQTTNTCCAVKQCGVDYAGHCGTALPNGCGGNSVACACASGTCTTNGGATPAPASGTPGSCCAPHPATYYTGQNQCGTNLPDGCGHTINATCATGQECVANTTGSPGPAPASGVVGSCCMRTDSCNLASGTCGPIQDSCRAAGTTYTCSKCTAGMQCTANTCCTPAPACTLGGADNAECNDSKQPVTPGCGSARACTCAGSRVCWCTDHVCGAADGTGGCKTPLTCGTGYGGLCGTSLSNGTGGTIPSCGCPTGETCSTSTPGMTGTCHCNNGLAQGYTCSNVPGGPGQPGGDACGTYDNGCGATLNCACAAGMACNTTPNPNVCCAPATCPAPALGSACGSVTNGCTAVNCGCPTGAGNENFMCSASKCACTPDTCRGRTGAQPDRCGGTLQCGG